jgi:hypothetical protein
MADETSKHMRPSAILHLALYTHEPPEPKVRCGCFFNIDKERVLGQTGSSYKNETTA